MRNDSEQDLRSQERSMTCRRTLPYPESSPVSITETRSGSGLRRAIRTIRATPVRMTRFTRLTTSTWKGARTEAQENGSNSGRFLTGGRFDARLSLERPLGRLNDRVD